MYKHTHGLPLGLRWLRVCWQCKDLGQSIPGSRISPGEEMATHSSILAWRIPWTRSQMDYSPWSPKESDKTE